MDGKSPFLFINGELTSVVRHTIGLIISSDVCIIHTMIYDQWVEFIS